MKLRNIPKTDLEVSPICLGTMTFGTPVGEANAIGIIQWASGEVIPIAGIAITALGGIFGYFIGARPHWNQFAAPRR